MALEPAKLSDFKLSGALGSGATARVYEAVHVVTGRPVAIKLMAEPTSVSGAPEMRERFAREALLLADVQSRHVSEIVGFGFDKGQPFLVLELLHGETLDAKLRRDGAIPLPTAVRWIEQLIVGVRDCHDAKVIHRDIKPANIFLHRENGGETVKLIDFGVARLREIAGVEAGGLTSPSHVIGSMGYMAPEQFRSAQSVGFPADLYAVGVVIYRALTGRLPFVSRSLEAVIRMKSAQAAPPLSATPGMVKNALLDWVVSKAMARDPEGRFQSAREMLDQWRNVMVSLDDSLDVGRVDESYAGRRPEARTAKLRSSHPSTAPPAPPRHDSGVLAGPALPRTSPVYAAETLDARWNQPGNLGDTIQQLAPIDDGEPTTASFSPSSEPFGPSSEPGERTTRTAAATPEGDDDRNAFEHQTRPNPNLRRLVERELELEKARRRGDG